MEYDVLCLRPKADFDNAGVVPPATLKIAYRAPDDPDTAGLARKARAVVLSAVGPKIPGSLFEGSAIKMVQVTGAGVDRLDESALRRLNIPVFNVPGASNTAVAEHAVTAASVLLRRFAWADAEIRAGNYKPFRGRMLVENPPGLDGLTVGVVGLGTIGLAVAEGFRKRSCPVLYFDPAPRDARAAAALGAEAASLKDLLQKSDVVSVHVPLLPATRGLIGAAELALMKRGAVLIQLSRGGVVDESALAKSLESGTLGGAAVDVYSIEPPEASNPLFALQGDAARRVLFTPHVGGITRQSTAVLFTTAWENVERVLVRGEQALNRVF